MASILLSSLVGVIVLFPFIIMIMLFFIYRRRGKAPALVIGRVSDLTTPFLLASVFIIAQTVFKQEVGIYLLMILLVLAMIFTVLEWKRVKDFKVKRLLSKIWRRFFIVLAFVYVVLLATGVVLTVIEYVY